MILRLKKRAFWLVVSSLALLLAAPILLVWLTAPSDPLYKGTRLSALLYEVWGNDSGATARSQPYAFDHAREALKELGPKAGPLLTAWIENRPSFLRDRFQLILIKTKVNWPYFTADHQYIVERLFFSVPEAAVPLAEAFQWQILNGPDKDATKAAVLFAYVINSTDPESANQIAIRSKQLASDLLDKLVRTGKDHYSMSLVGLILKNDPSQITPELCARIIRLGPKSRYLDNAVTLLKSTAPRESKATP